MVISDKESMTIRWGTTGPKVCFSDCGCPKNLPPKFSIIKQSFIMLMASVSQKFGHGIAGGLVCFTMPTTWDGKLQRDRIVRRLIYSQNWCLMVSVSWGNEVLFKWTCPWGLCIIYGESLHHGGLAPRPSVPRESHLENSLRSRNRTKGRRQMVKWAWGSGSEVRGKRRGRKEWPADPSTVFEGEDNSHGSG